MKYRGVEQLEARRAHNPEVVGSSPASATKKHRISTRNPVFFFHFLVRISRVSSRLARLTHKIDYFLCFIDLLSTINGLC